jgi:hypothetical protein
MKTAFFIVILSFVAPTLQAQNSSVVDALETFNAKFHLALQTGDEETYRLFFAEHVRVLHPGGQPETMRSDSLMQWLQTFGEPADLLKHMARGFVKLNRDGPPAFASIHNAPMHHQLIKITGDAVRLRKLPSRKSDVIVHLNRGVYNGVTPDRYGAICEGASGIEWLELELEHPALGVVRGFVASDFIEFIPLTAPKGVLIEAIEGELLITEMSLL